jgi:hypothetical protein
MTFDPILEVREFLEWIWNGVKKLFGSMGSAFNHPWRGSISPAVGPLEIQFEYVMKDRKALDMWVNLSDAVYPFKRLGYPVNMENKEVNPLEGGEYPRLRIDDQLYSVGYLERTEIIRLLDNVVKNKEALVNKQVADFKSVLQEHSWVICYSTPLYKHKRLEIIVPVENVYVGKKGFSMDVRINRAQGRYPNIDGVQGTISEMGQKIFDYRDEDSFTPEKYGLVGRKSANIHM